jgi:hypothetical protein
MPAEGLPWLEHEACCAPGRDGRPTDLRLTGGAPLVRPSHPCPRCRRRSSSTRRRRQRPSRRVTARPETQRQRNLRGLRALRELTDDFAVRVDDVLGLQSNAILLRWTNSGTDRATGGAFERQYLQLWVVGPDGLLARVEWFDADREVEALVRFDELTPAPSPPNPGGYVRVG